MTADQVLEVLEEVEFRYPTDEEVRYSLPAGLVLHAGETWWIRGESGWGKSTLMTLLAALRRFDRGRIGYRFEAAEPPTEVTPESWRVRVGPGLWRRIGFAFQRPELLRALNVIDNLELVGGKLDGVPLFDEQEWKGIAHNPVWRISGGQIQRLGLMRAFAGNQDLVFLDEPTNNLDRRNREQVAAFVEEQRQGRAVVLVSHDESFIESLSIDRVFEVAQRTIASGGLVRRLVEAEMPFPARRSTDPFEAAPAPISP